MAGEAYEFSVLEKKKNLIVWFHGVLELQASWVTNKL